MRSKADIKRELQSGLACPVLVRRAASFEERAVDRLDVDATVVAAGVSRPC